ncbi:GDP-mannose 4,6-dehydratase [Chloroflexota bacterium]
MTDFWKGKKALITGVTGFVGSYLAKSLLQQGAIVYGTLQNRADCVVPKNLKDKALEERISLCEGDLSNLYSLIRAVELCEPDVIFHLGAKSFVKESFDNPLLFAQTNCIGTANLLEAVRLRCPKTTVVFAGSSEEYGLAFSTQKQYEQVKAKYQTIFPEPVSIPEMPINENNPLRPVSPYAVSKVYGDYLFRQYNLSFGMNTIVTRAFNHEGAGRGAHFVTSVITRQVAKMKYKETDMITIGDVTAFRDWSHVSDIIKGYQIVAEKGQPGEVYALGSKRTNSVLTFLLLALEEAGYPVFEMSTVKGDRVISEPARMKKINMFGVELSASTVDQLLLTDELSLGPEDEGLVLNTGQGRINVVFNKERFRPSDVPILLSDPSKAMALGFEVTHELRDIVRDQLDFFFAPENRTAYSL